MKDKMLQEKVHLLIDLTQPLSHSLVFVIGQGDLISIQILWIPAAFSRVGCLQGNIACYREQWVSPPPKKLSSKFLPTSLAYRLSGGICSHSEWLLQALSKIQVNPGPVNGHPHTEIWGAQGISSSWNQLPYYLAERFQINTSGGITWHISLNGPSATKNFTKWNTDLEGWEGRMLAQVNLPQREGRLVKKQVNLFR